MRLAGVLLLMMPLLVYGQQTRLPIPNGKKSLEQHIQSFQQADGCTLGIPDVSNFISKLEENEGPKNNLKFCRVLFQKVRQEFLRQYAPYASFTETLYKGRYNCLTGTALYAILLEHFGIDYYVIETNYHIFLLASTTEGRVLFEATDPISGFVTNASEIEKRIQQYKQNTIQLTAGANKRYYVYNVNLYQQVSLTEITGLLHFNFSIEAYNRQNFAASIQHLDEALNLYSSPRISEFSSILLEAVVGSELNSDTKKEYISRIHALRRKQLPLLARRAQAN